MSEEELEKTGMINKTLVNLEEEEMTIDEMLEEFLEKVDYMDISERKKESLKRLCKEIKKEEDNKAKEYLFKLLIKQANDK